MARLVLRPSGSTKHGQRHGRQSEPDDALDEAGCNKGDGNQGQ